MGLTTAAIVGIGSLVGAGIGGGSVAYYHYRKEKREKEKREQYYRDLADMRLRDRRINARIYSQ